MNPPKPRKRGKRPSKPKKLVIYSFEISVADSELATISQGGVTRYFELRFAKKIRDWLNEYILWAESRSDSETK